MNPEDLLRAMRDVYLLVPKPGRQPSGDKRFWSMQLAGLDDSSIKRASVDLRQKHQKDGVTVSAEESLKTKALNDGLAVALGGESYDLWKAQEIRRLHTFLAKNGMTRPADLIHWSYRPGFAEALTAERLADRFFNSGMPLPGRLFTGVGSFLFAPSGYGRMDIQELSGRPMDEDEDRLAFCEHHADDILLHATEFKGEDCPLSMAVTGRMLMLHAASEFVGGIYNLLGDNLMQPKTYGPVFTHYNVDEKERALDVRLFELFMDQIGQSDEGWVDVLAFPGNANLVFLKGADGAFDWVVRDQRSKEPLGNPLYPMFMSDEVPSAMSESKLSAHIYFSRGRWLEKLQHNAETRHYAEGGVAANWPGYTQLVQRELVASRGYSTPRPLYGSTGGAGFTAHRLQDRCLMVSALVTIEDFFNFYDGSEWARLRQGRATKANQRLELDLYAVNRDEPDLPVSVTWFDAVAYCRAYEKQAGLPVRLLGVEEWRQVAPEPLQDPAKGWGDLTWIVKDLNGLPAYESQQRFEECGGGLRYGGVLRWSTNREGVGFLGVVDAGEWLSEYSHGHACAANAATGKALVGGLLERNKCLAGLTMRYKGFKVGFRLCYVAQLDS